MDIKFNILILGNNGERCAHQMIELPSDMEYIDFLCRMVMFPLNLWNKIIDIRNLATSSSLFKVHPVNYRAPIRETFLEDKVNLVINKEILPLPEHLVMFESAFKRETNPNIGSCKQNIDLVKKR